jgi:hypothetical protein
MGQHLGQARFVLCQQQALSHLVGSHAHPWSATR